MEGQACVLSLNQAVRWKGGGSAPCFSLLKNCLHQSYHKHPRKGSWVCAPNIILSTNEDGRAGSRTSLNLDFQMKRQVCALSLRVLRKDMEGQLI